MIFLVHTSDKFGLYELFKLVHRYMVAEPDHSFVRVDEEAKVTVKPNPISFLTIENSYTRVRTVVSLSQFLRRAFGIPESMEMEVSSPASWLSHDLIDDPIFDIRFLQADYNVWSREMGILSGGAVKEVAFLHSVHDYSYQRDDMGWEYCVADKTVPDLGGVPAQGIPGLFWSLETSNDPRD